MSDDRWAAAPSWFIADGTIPASTKVVFMAIATHSKPSGEAFPSQALIAAESGCSIATVRRATRELEALGLLRTEQVKSRHGRRNHYVIWRPQVKGDASLMSGAYRSPQTEEQEPPEQEPSIQDIVGVLQ